MQLGMIGLGKMGGNMARRLRQAGIEVVGFNRDASATQALAAECGLLPAESTEELVAMLHAPRLVWLMLPAGEITESYVQQMRELLQPGGDVAATQPWRMGAAALFDLGREAEISVRFADQTGSSVIAEMLCKRINSPPTSSCGRLFDAACGLLNVVPRASFEGQAPMVLEALVESPSILDAGWTERNGVLEGGHRVLGGVARAAPVSERNRVDAHPRQHDDPSWIDAKAIRRMAGGG